MIPSDTSDFGDRFVGVDEFDFLGAVDEYAFIYHPLRRLTDAIDWRRLREGRCLTLRQTAARAGISAPYLSRIENGLRHPSDAAATRLADVLELDQLLVAEMNWALRSQEPEQESSAPPGDA
jgi:Helix-turn-helix domain